MTGSGFQSFVPVIPVFIIVLLLMISVGISWWSYNYLKQLSPLKKNGLIGLRAASLFILLILLLNPLFVNQSSWEEKPTVLVYIDNSQSTAIERGDYAGQDDYYKIIDQFEFENNQDVNYLIYNFDGDVQRVESTNIEANGVSTNLDNVFKHQFEQAPDAIAALLFSDGIITRGQEPVFSAQNSSIPFFTVPVGDTTSAKDIAVSDVESLKEVYTNSSFSVNTIIQQEGYDGKIATVQIIEDGEVLESKQISFTGNRSSHEIRFQLIHEEPGIRNYEIKVPSFEDELTTENNSAFFSVNVEDDKTDIWYLAFEVHPDVGAIRNIIARDQSFEVKPYTWLPTGNFIGGNPDENEEEPNLIIIHGLPNNSETMDWVIEKMQSYSSLFIVTPGSFNQFLQRQSSFYNISRSESFIPIRPEPGDKETHPIFDIDPVQTMRMPSLQTRFGTYNLSPTQQILGMSRYQNKLTDIPYLIIEESGNTRKLFLNAFDWFKYTQSRDEEIRKFTNQFFTNIVSWTSALPDQSNLQVSTLRSSYNENEEIIIRATLQNESGQPETNGLIDVQIQNRKNGIQSSSFTMQHQENGNYRLNAGTLPSGQYNFTATARIGDRIAEEQTDNFSVTSSTREFLDTKRNDQRLRQIAEVSGGQFLDASSAAENFITNLEERNLMQTVEKTRKELIYLHQFYFWFFIVLVTLSSEWILRKSVSLP